LRYQNPIPNPLSQYWEEDLVFGGFSKYWNSFLNWIKYLWIEHLVANLIQVLSIAIRISPVSQLMASISRHYGNYGLKLAIKRLIDLTGVSIGIILSTPFFIIVPVLIKLDSPGPVFYRQERVGKNRRRAGQPCIDVPLQKGIPVFDRRRKHGFGKPFMVIKFRTMFHNAEKDSGPVWTRKNDPRITRVGAFLRTTRIDEIPQLFNVLKGDMSLVGPRPEREFFIEKLKNHIDGYEKRLLVKPGLTGLAQVEHKYDESEDDVKVKVKYDIDYIRDLKILLDLKIILKTIIVVLTAKGM
jgi:lipopolysaccharide/colanic/teichoic acid biosynthesis glycosyltransferase